MVYTDRTHLVADTVEELHAFAKKIGLHRAWFQDHDKHPHYDLFGNMKKRALWSGAKLVSARDIVDLFNLKEPNGTKAT